MTLSQVKICITTIINPNQQKQLKGGEDITIVDIDAI